MANSINPSFVQLLKNPPQMLAFGFGSGLAPKAPGTFGTLAAIPFYFLFKELPLPYYLLMLALTFIAGVWLCDVASKQLGVHDPGGIVWDEMVGLWLTMTLAPAGWLYLFLGFVFFRIFDILKPWPIGWLDRKVSGGFGIMIDDVLAGVYAWLCLYLVSQLL